MIKNHRVRYKEQPLRVGLGWGQCSYMPKGLHNVHDPNHTQKEQKQSLPSSYPN